MSAIEDLIRQHEILLEQMDRPVQATKGWASRGESFSTGLAGVQFALQAVRGQDFSPELQAPELNNIFSAGMQTSPGDLTILHNFNEEIELDEAYGDVFVGKCSKVWTRLVLGRQPEISSRTTGEGAVTRPGLGHGELIRGLVEWLTQDPKRRGTFIPPERDFISGGWCNGESGLLAAACIARYFDASTESDKFITKTCLNLLDWAQTSSREESGLCHGTVGALVVVAGAGRLIQSERITSEANNIFQHLASHDFNIRIHPDFIVDASWLTGTAGLIWASAAIKQKPGINPLLPIDSRLFN
jgi:hypothetical protein